VAVDQRQLSLSDLIKKSTKQTYLISYGIDLVKVCLVIVASTGIKPNKMNYHLTMKMSQTV
jgi:hypothetical protein